MSDEASHPTYEFDRATAVDEIAPGTYRGDVDAGFTVGPKPNGGYLVAMAVRAMRHALAAAGSGHADPLATTTHFVGAPDPGPVDLEVTVLRTGRSASQARAVITQDGAPCVDVVATLGTLRTDPAPAAWQAAAPFPVAPAEACTRLPAEPPGAAFRVSIMDRAEARLDPETLGWALGQPDGRGDLRGWISFADGRPTDPLGMLFFLDALPPATFSVVRTGWVPTLSLTTYLRAAPGPGPLRIRQRAQAIDDGRVDEVCELWDDHGRLVGHATQLAGIRYDADAALTPHPDAVEAASTELGPAAT
ncbi:MAG: thioesterase family protein [Acidimicrobiales bacterium]|nr:thioesterase family protein [Acidimicrobiales bacterium]